MATVSIEKIRKPVGMLPAFEEFERFADAIPRRAYQLCEDPGGNKARDFDDRLRAERQIVVAPASEVVEKEDLLVLYLLLAGYTPEEVAVMAGPNGVLLRAGTKPDEGDSRDGRDRPNVMRRFAFATAVDVGSVAATLNKGVLTINAAKTNRG